MSSKRISYPPEYRQQIVELYRAGRKFSELAREFEPSEQTIRTWVRQTDLDAVSHGWCDDAGATGWRPEAWDPRVMCIVVIAHGQ